MIRAPSCGQDSHNICRETTTTQRVIQQCSPASCPVHLLGSQRNVEDVNVSSHVWQQTDLRLWAAPSQCLSVRVSLSAPQTHRTVCKLKRTQFLALARFIGTFWCHPQRGGLTWTSQGGPCTGQTPCGLPYSLCGMWLSQPLTSLFRTYRTSRKHLHCRIPRCILRIWANTNFVIASPSTARRRQMSEIWKWCGGHENIFLVSICSVAYPLTFESWRAVLFLPCKGSITISCLIVIWYDWLDEKMGGGCVLENTKYVFTIPSYPGVFSFQNQRDVPLREKMKSILSKRW